MRAASSGLMLVLFFIMVSAPGAEPYDAEAEKARLLGRRLHAAAQSGDPDLVGRLLREGARVDFRDTDGYDAGETALHKAAFAGNHRVLSVLLKAGAPVDARDARGETPLLQAAFGQQGKSARILLANGADPKGASRKGLFPLQASAFQGDVKTARILRSAGADLNQKDKLGRTALMTASRKHIRMVKWLLAAGADVNAKTATGTTALMVAATAAREDILRELVNAGADVNARRRNGRDAGYYAIRQFFTADPEQTRRLMEYLWKKGARPADKIIWVRIAISRRRVPTLKFLLSVGFSVRDKRLSAEIGRYARDDHYTRDMRNLLIRHGAVFPSGRVDQSYYKYSHRKLRRMIAEGRADPRQVLGRMLKPRLYFSSTKARTERDQVVIAAIRRLRRDGKEPSINHRKRIWNHSLKGSYLSVELPFQLKLAAPHAPSTLCGLQKKPELLHRLIKMGLDVNGGPEKGDLLRHLLICDAPELVRIFLKAGARKDVRGWSGFPLLTEARTLEMARAMLDGGIFVHRDALCHVIPGKRRPKSFFRLVPALLAKGASPSCRLRHGESLLAWAARVNYSELAKLLKDAGARDPSNLLYHYLEKEPEKVRGFLKSGRVFVGTNAIALALKYKRRELYSLLADHYGNLKGTLPINVINTAYHARPWSETMIQEAREFLRMLMERRVNPDAVRYTNRTTALMTAAGVGDPLLVSLLLRGGARVDARDSGNSTALFKSRRPETTGLLLRHGARVYLKDANGETPLHRAVHQDVKIVRLLMMYGADPRVENRYGESPIERARGGKHWKALRAMGVSPPSTSRSDHRRKFIIKKKVLEDRTIIITEKKIRELKKDPARLRRRSDNRGPLNPANPTPKER